MASTPPAAPACIERMVRAVAVGEGNKRRSSRATWMMKNFRRGVLKKRPTKVQTIVMVNMRPMSSIGDLLTAGRIVVSKPRRKSEEEKKVGGAALTEAQAVHGRQTSNENSADTSGSGSGGLHNTVVTLMCQYWDLIQVQRAMSRRYRIRHGK